MGSSRLHGFDERPRGEVASELENGPAYAGPSSSQLLDSRKLREEEALR